MTDAPPAVRRSRRSSSVRSSRCSSFVCSVGNVPLAAVLWSGGISFAGVMAFVFADLIVLPIVAHLSQVLRLDSACGSRR